MSEEKTLEQVRDAAIIAACEEYDKQRDAAFAAYHAAEAKHKEACNTAVAVAHQLYAEKAEERRQEMVEANAERIAALKIELSELVGQG